MTMGKKATLIGCAAIWVAAMPTAAFAQQRNFDLPAQSATKSIPEFARQAGIQIVAPGSKLRNIRTRALKGAQDVRAALNILLQGTGLRIVADDGRTVTLGLSPASDSAPAAAGGNAATVERKALSEAVEQPDTEILVTARKRIETLSDVPISISVLGADEISRRGLVNAQDYLRGMPGVNQSDSGVGGSIVIRGLETTTANQGFASGNTVGVYFGETSTTSSSGIIGGSSVDIRLVDIERVEVLRGPQGTAFGSSSLGGVVRTIPVAPRTDKVEGRITVGASLTERTGGDNMSAEAVLNIPLVQDVLAVRAVGYRFVNSGYYRNRASSDPELQASAARFGAAQFAVDDKEVGELTVSGGRIAALLTPTDDFRLTLSYLRQHSRQDGWDGANRAGYNQAIYRVGPAGLVNGLDRAGQKYDLQLANATAEYSLGKVDLVATYSYIDSKSAQAFPFSARPSGVLQLPLVTASHANHREHSGEVRLVTNFDGPVNFLAGLYAEDLKDDWQQPVYFYGNPATSTFPSKTQFVNLIDDDLSLVQKAAFGEVSWKVLPGLEVTGGVRAYHFKRRVIDVAGGDVSGPTKRTEVANKASGTNFRGNISYKPDQALLLYASFSQGFRLGKPQPGLPAASCDANGDGTVDNTSIPIASTRQIQSDTVDSYEAGVKFRPSSRLTVDADIFRADWNNIPVQVQQQCGVVSFGYTANAGSARSEGVEAQLAFKASDALRLDIGGSYTRARLMSAVPAQGFRAGDRLPSPKFNANFGAEYRFELAGHKAFWRADAVYVGSFYSNVGNRVARNRAGDYVKFDTSLRALIDGGFSMDLYVQNLLNSDATTYVLNNNNAYRLRPRTFGVRVGYQF